MLRKYKGVANIFNENIHKSHFLAIFLDVTLFLNMIQAILYSSKFDLNIFSRQILRVKKIQVYYRKYKHRKNVSLKTGLISFSAPSYQFQYGLEKFKLGNYDWIKFRCLGSYNIMHDNLCPKRIARHLQIARSVEQTLSDLSSYIPFPS